MKGKKYFFNAIKFLNLVKIIEIERLWLIRVWNGVVLLHLVQVTTLTNMYHRISEQYIYGRKGGLFRLATKSEEKETAS